MNEFEKRFVSGADWSLFARMNDPRAKNPKIGDGDFYGCPLRRRCDGCNRQHRNCTCRFCDSCLAGRHFCSGGGCVCC